MNCLKTFLFLKTRVSLGLGFWLLVCGGLGLPQTAGAATTSFLFAGATSAYAGVTYSVVSNNTVTFNVQARNGAFFDPTFNGPVTVGLYDTATTLAAQPAGVFVPATAAMGDPVTAGTAPMTFVNGVLNFAVTLTSGVDSMDVSISCPTVSSGNSYPGNIGVTVISATYPGYIVKGYSSQLWFETASQTQAAVSYSPTPGDTDYLLQSLDVGFTNATDQSVTITNSSSINNSICFAVTTALSGGYAGAGAGIVPNFWFWRQNTSSTTTVVYQIILDYNGNLTDFNSPNLGEDTVYQGSWTNGGGSGLGSATAANSATFFAGVPSFPPFMNNGKIIVRLWSDAVPPGNFAHMNFASTSFPIVKYSTLQIPYSSSNTRPVQATLSPKVVLGGSVTTLSYVIKNQYSSPISYLSFEIPANSSGVSYWNINSLSMVPSLGGGLSSVQPSGSIPGSVIFNSSGGSPIASNQTVTINMGVTCSSQTNNWTFPIISALASGGLVAPDDSAGTTIQTLGVPGIPTGFTAAVTNYIHTGGGSVSLFWTPPSNTENPTGYIISGGPNGPITINSYSQSSAVDSPVANLTGYTYSIKTINQVAQSGTATASPNPVTAYANPGPPTGLQVYTGAATLQLRWTAPVSVAGSYAVTGYQVWRGTTSGAESFVTNVAGGSTPVTFIDTGFSAGVSNFYFVSAMDSQYSSGPTFGPHHSTASTEAVGFPPGNPPAGVNVNLTQGPDTLHVNWSAPSNVLNTPLSNYYVFRSVNAGAYAAYATVGGGTLTYPDTAVLTGNSYNYFVQALDNLAVVSNASATVTGQVGPSAPAAPVAAASSAGVTLTWAPNSGSENVADYVVVRSPGVSSATSGPASFFDGTAAVGTDYSYYVMAVNNLGVTGLASTTITSARLLGSPASFGVTANGAVRNTMDLTWTAPTVGGNQTGYRIYRDTNAAFSGAVSVNTLSLSTFSYQDPGLSAGTTYFYYLQAVNIGGAGASITAGQQVPPRPPQNLIAIQTNSNSVSLRWSTAPVSEVVNNYSLYGKDLGPPAGSFTFLTNISVPRFNYTGTLAGHDYQFYVTATNIGTAGAPGGESLASVTITAAPKAVAPTGLTVAPDPATPSTFNLNWTASSEANVTGYILSRGTDTVFPPTGSGAATINLGLVTSYVDPGLSAGTTYFYYLQAVNIGGGGVTTAVVGQQAPPNPPTGLSSVPKTGAVSLYWNSAPVSENVSTYTVYGKDQASGSFSALGTSGTTGFNDATVLAGHSYLYYITATNPGGTAGNPPGGMGLASTTITSGPLPSAPAGLTITGINTSNDISSAWTDVTGAVANAASLDLLVNSSNVTTGATVNNITPATTTVYSDNGKTPDTIYYYWLRSNNPYGPGALAGPVTQLTYPGAVSLMPVTIAPDGISRILNWPPLTYATQYRVYRQLQGAGNFILVQTYQVTSLTLPVTLTLPVQGGKAYDYKIVAVNPTGAGPDSNIQSVNTLPSAPVSVTAQSGISNAVTQVDVSWAYPTAASEGVTGFTVYRATDKTALVNFAPVTTGDTALAYSDGAVIGGTVYYYIVTAENNSGLETKLLLANAVAVTAYASPNPPTSPLVVSGNASANLSWMGVSATSYPVSLYRVARVSSGVTAVFTTPGVNYSDTGLTNGAVYIYSVQTLDNQGYLSVPSAPVTGLPQSGPGIPGNVTASVGDQSLQITWNSSTPGTYPIGSYQVYKSSGGPFSLLTTLGPSATGYVDNTPPLTNGQNYSYYVVALDNFGTVPILDVSANSATVTGSPVANRVNPPSNILASAGVSQVMISWTDSVTVSGLGTAISYDLFSSTSQSSGYAILGNYPPSGSGGSTITNSNLNNGITYYYYLVAHSATGVSSNSATVFAIPSAPPSAPATLTVTDGNNQAVLNWSASPNQGSITISKYFINQGISPASPAFLGFTAGPVTAYTDNSITNGTTVVYQVGAVNSNNSSGNPSVSVNSYPYAPFAPTALSSVSSGSGVTLNWTPSGSNSWTVTQFALLRTPAGGGSAATLFAPSSPLIDASAIQGQLYTYTVQAMDDKGHISAASNPVTDGPAIAPAAPTTVIATAGDTQILVDWPASAPATGAMPVSYYILTGPAGGPVTLPPGQTWYLDSPLANPTTVSYSVIAVDISGQDASPVHISGTTSSGPATTSAANLNPPTALAVTLAGTTSLNLTWDQPNDMGKIVTSYNIYRATSFSAGGGSLLVNLANPALAPVTAYSDTGLTPGTTYYYVVRAVYGPSSTESPNSNHAFGSTPAPGTPIPPVTVGQMAFDANLLLLGTGQQLGIYYNVPNDGVVEIDIYNIAGNQIATLVPGMTTANASHSVLWDGKDRNGNRVASGLYLIEIRATGFHQVKKVAVVK